MRVENVRINAASNGYILTKDLIVKESSKDVDFDEYRTEKVLFLDWEELVEELKNNPLEKETA